MAKKTNEVIEALCKGRTEGHIILEEISRVYQNIVGSQRDFLQKKRSGGIASKEKMLILLALHTASGTNQAIEFSMTSALQYGASDQEILDALELALLTGGGNAVARAQFAATVMRYRQGGVKKTYFPDENIAAKGR